MERSAVSQKMTTNPGCPRNCLKYGSKTTTNPRVPHIWRALCARCGKPQISPLRFAPVEMTNLWQRLETDAQFP